MNPERLRQIEELYHSARELAPRERGVFLEQVCRGDDELLREVESLLAQDSSGGPMEQPVLQVAANLLGTQWASGTQVGPYEILSRLGEGGMGEVYKARDTRLGRAVAIKTANAEFSGRFQREARAISALNHPHICTLHDVGPNYLVMELLEGETLAHRLEKGRLPIDLVLRHGAQIADALSAAHAQGIIHRDLKPSNIMVTKSGIKVLDFGLAKFARTQDPAAEKSATLTASQTILGTPAYMAPEQLEGKDCDARTDIFALGLLLYEMAAGRKAFVGDSQAALTAEIMRCEPAPLETASPPFAHLVDRCLEKDPENRWQSARDVKLELDFQTRTLTSAPTPERRKWRLWTVAAAAVALAVLAAAVVDFRKDQPEPSVVPLTTDTGMQLAPTFSPDGAQVAYVWNDESEDKSDIYVKQIGSGNPVRLTRQSAQYARPRWSPDGKWIAFLRAQDGQTDGVFVIPALGGMERKVGDAASRVICLDWSPNGQWLVISIRPYADQRLALGLLSFETGETRQLLRKRAVEASVF